MVGQGQTSLKNSDLTPFIDEKIEVQIKHTWTTANSRPESRFPDNYSQGT